MSRHHHRVNSFIAIIASRVCIRLSNAFCDGATASSASSLPTPVMQNRLSTLARRATTFCGLANNALLRLSDSAPLADVVTRATKTWCDSLASAAALSAVSLHAALVPTCSPVHGIGFSVRSPVSAGQTLLYESEPLYLVKNSLETAATFADALEKGRVGGRVKNALLLSLAGGGDCVCDCESGTPAPVAATAAAFFETAFSSNVMRFAWPDFAIDHDTHTESLARGVFLFGSRFNHSCSPDAIANFGSADSGANERDQKNSLRVVALRDLAAGEEVRIAYCSPLDAPDIKRLKLGFDHTGVDGGGCALCCPQSRLLEVTAAQGDEADSCVAEMGRQIDECLLRVVQLAGGGKQAAAMVIPFMKKFHRERLATAPIGQMHFLRVRFAQEALSAGVLVSVSNKEEHEFLLERAEELRNAGRELLPEHFPLRASFDMHLAFLLAVGARLEAARLKVEFCREWWEEKDEETFERCVSLVSSAEESHCKIRDDFDFTERFASELSCCDFI